MSFRRYAAERVGITALVLFLCACFCYVCFHVIGIDTSGTQWDPAELARLHRFEHQGFGDFLWQLVGHGSLGRTVKFDGASNGLDLNSWVTDAAHVTFSLASGALVLAILVGIPLGLAWSRWRQVRFFGTPFVYLMFGLIQVWVALILEYFFAYRTEVLPSSGYCPIVADSSSDCSGLVQWAYHLVLPWITLGYLLVAIHAVVVRRLSSGVARAASEPTADRAEAVAAARRHRRVAYGKMAARNWFWLIGATLFVETSDGLHGLSLLASSFAVQGDLAGLQAVLLFTSLIAIGGWLVVDLAGAAVSRHWREL